MRTKTLFLILALAVFPIACDSPSENATEERIEDKGDAAGQSEDAAEKQGEAVSEGATPVTDTAATTTTGTTGTTETTVTTATSTTTT